MTEREKKYLPAEGWVSWGAFFILLITYWITVAPTVSFWDCPEYVSAAYLLEIGHPPGNPVWMLVERIVTMLAPSARYAALAVNLSSGLFTAFAAFFLAKTIFRVGLWVLLKLPRRRIPAPLAAAGGALTGALAFGWCDSAWYSAVEAEVYAMSIFMTALCVWLMTKWAGTRNRIDSWRLLILIAYLFGLSIGIHQLNLLCIPALAMVWAIRRGIHSTIKLSLIFLLSLMAVACVLMGMMPSTIALAAEFEIIFVNRLGLPQLSGVAIYVILLGLSLLLALWTTRHNVSRVIMGASCFPAIFLSGIFIFSEHFLIGALVSVIASALLVSGNNFKSRRLCLAIWMLAMLLTGYSSYALIPIRGSIPSPANAAMPGEPFAFAAYQSREQYGAKPLLYGPTPYSRSMLREDFDSSGNAQYKYYKVDYLRPQMMVKEEGARLRSRIPGLSPADSAENARMMSRDGDAYITVGMKSRMVKTPELNMWFPRITSSEANDLASYADWIGMTPETMDKVEITEAIDTAGNAVGKIGADGKRHKATSHRPTYLQNAEWFATYQTSYMYWRYLLWNFAGRQNDRPSQGEVQHGNFITGFPFIDNAMLGAEDYLPAAAGKENPGRNRYFLLPLLIGIIGMMWLLKSGRRGIQTCSVTAILFILTGLAIVVYLNQDPAEARERDYSFLGSFWAYAVWIGFGAIMIARRTRSVWGFAIPLAVTIWMGIENFDDHDRSNRTAAREFPINILNSLEPNAVIFVNGDNHTFPLWYAQEVEKIRPDVRVVNLSYLELPVYAANLMRDWRESKALNTTLKREDVIYGATRMARIGSRDTLPATVAIDSMRRSADASFPCRYVTISVTPDSVVTLDLRQLRNGGSSASFGRLMMLDIVATNAAEGNKRPIYWMNALGANKRIGLIGVTSPRLFGVKFGLENKAENLAAVTDEVAHTGPANPVGRDVYMDHAPAIQVSTQRASLTAAARRLLRAGETDRAVMAARKADIMMGEDGGTYLQVILGDSAFNTHRELGQLLIDCADSLWKNSRIDFTLARGRRLSPRQRFVQAQVIELRARGRKLLRDNRRNLEAWGNYRRHLPARLRSKMAPTY